MAMWSWQSPVPQPSAEFLAPFSRNPDKGGMSAAASLGNIAYSANEPWFVNYVKVRAMNEL